MRIFYDVDTQKDFMNSDGALYVPDAESIKPNLGLLTEFARKNKIPILGSIDRHYGTDEYREREGELARWGGPFPDHCMVGTEGVKKIPETRSEDAFYVRSRIDSDEFLPDLDIAQEAGSFLSHRISVIFEKQHYDVFTNSFVAQVLEDAKVREAVVYGVATDYCVKAAVLGMQQRGIQTYVVEDAIRGVFPESTKSALEEMALAGAKFVKTQDVIQGGLK